MTIGKPASINGQPDDMIDANRCGSPHPPPPNRTRLGLAAAALVVMYGGLWFGYQSWQLALWLSSLFLLVTAFQNPPQAEQSPGEPWTRSELIAFCAILALAVFFRLYHLDNLPPSVWVDECHAAGRGAQLMDRDDLAPFGCTPLTWLVDWVHMTNLYLYSVGLTLEVFGRNYWGIKMNSVIPGILGVPILYLFCRELAGRTTALFAGLLFAVGHWNVRLSRWGWVEVTMTTLQIVSCYYLVRGFRRGRPRDFVVSGIWMGLCLYSYVASRLAFAATIACLAPYLVCRWGNWARRARPLVLFVLGTVFTVAPVTVFYLQHPAILTVRTYESSIFRLVEEAKSWQPLWNNMWAHILMFHTRGDWISRHGIPREPMLDVVTGALFLAGLLIALWKWRTPGYLLCLTWVAVGLLAGILSQNYGYAHAYRTGNVAPAVMALAALGPGWALSRGLLRGQAIRAIAVALSALLIAVVVQLNFVNYFVTFPKVEGLWGETLIARGSNLARYLHQRDKDERRYMDRSFEDAGFWCLQGDLPPIDKWSPEGDRPPTEASTDIVYLSTPKWRPWLEVSYPNTRWTELKEPLGNVYCHVAEIPREDLAASLGLRRYIVAPGGPAADTSDALKSGVLDGSTDTGTIFEGTYYQEDQAPIFLTFGVPDGDVAGIWLDGVRVLQPGDYMSTERSSVRGPHSVWFLVRGEQEGLPRVLIRRRGQRGEELPGDRLSRSATDPRPGLRVTFQAGVDTAAELSPGKEAPLLVDGQDFPEAPYTAVWDGYLRIDEEGEYVLGAIMDQGGDLRLDGERILETATTGYAEARLSLSPGMHPIQARVFRRSPGAANLTLRWIPPSKREHIEQDLWHESGFTDLPEDWFYQLRFMGRGLRARYYSNQEFEGEPFRTVLEPIPLLGHNQDVYFSVELDGYIRFPASGRYWLGTSSDDGSWLYLDGKLLVDSGGPHGIEQKGATVDVTEGLHEIRVRYFQNIAVARLQILWAKDDHPPVEIVPTFFYPPEGFPG